VAKEAVLKAHGAGLRIGPARFAIVRDADGGASATLPDGTRWQLQWVSAPEGFRAAVAMAAM
jgi:phosphopantetheinyl transferase